MPELTDKQEETLTEVREHIEHSQEQGHHFIVLAMSINDKDYLNVQAFGDKEANEWRWPEIFTAMESLTFIAESLEPCPCEHCRKYKDRIDMIRQIIKPN